MPKKLEIQIKDIRPEGYHLEKKFKAEDIELTDESVKILTPLNVKADLEKTGKTVIAKMDVQGGYEFPCARCLAPIHVEKIDQLKLYIDIDPSMEFIDLGEEIRQEMVIMFSNMVLGGEDQDAYCSECKNNADKTKRVEFIYKNGQRKIKES